MPWQNSNHRYFLNEESINSNAPVESGVYGLYNIMNWVYIGESANIREALIDHSRGRDSCLRNAVPTGFTFELCPADLRARRAEALVAELAPVCNRTKLRKVLGL